ARRRRAASPAAPVALGAPEAGVALALRVASPRASGKRVPRGAVRRMRGADDRRPRREHVDAIRDVPRRTLRAARRGAATAFARPALRGSDAPSRLPAFV